MDAAVRIIANVQTPLSIQPKGGMFEDKGEPFANLVGGRMWKEQGRKKRRVGRGRVTGRKIVYGTSVVREGFPPLCFCAFKSGPFVGKFLVLATP
ncbi:hypothetical protein V1478_017038 [Vespula squamosa]|uniref:Uncharacterized protein n=1 Tax=Vespula squamosa TaxID=30214 RepID=A0ABD1ZY89_VESSQ